MHKFLWLYLISGSFLAAFVSAKDVGCSVEFQGARVNGVLTQTANPNKTVCAYMSIPYAQKPIGLLRFQPPQPTKINGTYNAIRFPNWCPQSIPPPLGILMSEDCLYLNVYQPMSTSSSNSSSLPVMIWFHGGAFTSGSSLPYAPTKLLARDDVILVVVHYRLGVLGFFSTGDGVVPGNQGLKDQALSIRWVNENIAAFGGNPSQVTIFGESAGGASVMYQFISPLNKGLIHGVISQSGTALASWPIDRNPTESGKLVASRHNCSSSNSSEILECMRKVPWLEIIIRQSTFTTESLLNFTNPVAGVAPVIEPNLPGAFISDEPLEIMKNGDIPDIPVLIGANKHDGSYVMGVMYLTKFGPENLDTNETYMRNEIVSDLLKFVNIHEDPANRVVASSVELAFLNGVNRSSWSESMPGLVDILTVFAYKSSVQHTADLLVQRNRKAYVYSMEYESNNTLWYYYFGANTDVPVVHDVTHGDELMYMFDFGAIFSTRDQQFSNTICDLWLNFGIHGNPTPNASSKNQQWAPYNTIDEPFMKLSLPPSIEYGYRNSWRPSANRKTTTSHI